MAQVKITCRRNGPYRVEAPEGTIELVDADGNPYDLTGKVAFSLCRCGASVNKPFCDGTHSKMGFDAAEAAVKKADEGTLAPEPLTGGSGSRQLLVCRARGTPILMTSFPRAEARGFHLASRTARLLEGRGRFIVLLRLL